jgi:exonuclease III
MTRLLNWNVRNSAPTLIERQVAYLQGIDADTLILTEVNCNHLAAWSNRLLAAGYESVVPVEFEETARGVLLASRVGIEPLPTLFKHPLCQCSLSAIIQIGSKPVELHGVYARADGGWPIKKRYKKDIHRAVAKGIGDRIVEHLSFSAFSTSWTHNTVPSIFNYSPHQLIHGALGVTVHE